jgi:hypothetical protein
VSLLSVIVDVCGRQGLVKPATVVGNTDRQVSQLCSLANQAGRELARDHAWQALLEEATFETMAAGGQPTAIPADLDWIVPDSIFNRSTMRQVTGPITPQQWQALQAIPALNTVYLMFRERAGELLIVPTPPGGQLIAYEYVSLNWCYSPAKGAGANSTPLTPRPAYQADTDVAYLDETLIADSLEWRFLAKKGLSYAEEMATFERNKERAMGRDGASGALTLSPRPINLSRVNLPDGGFPGPA